MHAHGGFLTARMVFSVFCKRMFTSVVSKRGFFCSSPEEGHQTKDGRVGTKEGPRWPLQVGACELDLELGEVEDLCEAEEQEDDDANLGEHV